MRRFKSCLRNVKVQHKRRPAEPWAKSNAVGFVNGRKSGQQFVPRITPSGSGIPAMVHVNWGDYDTWERLADVKFL